MKKSAGIDRYATATIYTQQVNVLIESLIDNMDLHKVKQSPDKAALCNSLFVQYKDSLYRTVHDLVNCTAVKQTIDDVMMVFHQA